jgi:hypothetical protein
MASQNRNFSHDKGEKQKKKKKMSDALCHVNMRLLKQQQSLTCHTISDIFDSCNTRQAERRPFTLFRLKTLGQLPLPHEIQRRPTRVTSKLAEAPEPAGTTWYQV